MTKNINNSSSLYDIYLIYLVQWSNVVTEEEEEEEEEMRMRNKTYIVDDWTLMRILAAFLFALTKYS